MPDHPDRLLELLDDSGLAPIDSSPIRFLRPETIEITIKTLKESALFTSPILLMVFYHPDPFHFATLLAKLKSDHCLNDAIINSLLGHADPYSLTIAISTLHDKRLSTPDKIAAVTTHPHPDDLAWSFNEMHRLDLLTPANQEALVSCKSPTRLAIGLYHLHANHLLTEVNRLTLLDCIDDPPILELLEVLSHNTLLNQANFTHVTRRDDPQSLLDGLKLLARDHLLTQFHFDYLIRYHQPIQLAIAIGALGRSHLLTELNLQALIHHRDFNALIFPLHVLEWGEILTQQSFDALLDERHQILLTTEMRDLIWDRLPEEALRIHFAEILATARGVNPLHRLRQLLNHLMRPHHTPLIFNPAQGTHTTSIHKSASTSATMLSHRYREIDIDENLTALRNQLMRLDDTPIHRAAKAAFLRLTQSPHPFIEPVSSLSTIELLAYTFAAVHDEAQLVCAKEEAFRHLIEGLYEIQRGYNINEAGVDNELADSPICSAGAFNKLIEKLWGIHKDVELRYLTHQAASLKFHRIAIDEAQQYLEQFKRPSCKDEYDALRDLIATLKSEGLQILWPVIKENVTRQLMEEFGELYNNKVTHPDFISLLENIAYIAMEDKTCDLLLHQAAAHLEQSPSPAREPRFFREAYARLEPTSEDLENKERSTP